MPAKVSVKPVESPLPLPERRTDVPVWRRVLAGVLKTLVPIAILAVAAKISWALFQTAPIAERADRPRVPRLVEVVEVHPATVGPPIEAWGEVIAARTLAVRPEIGGRVVALSSGLTEGGLIAAGDDLIRLDAREQAYDLARAEAEIGQVEARIAIEEGQQDRARRDLTRLPGNLTDRQRSLVLRAPQMAELQAELAAAEAARGRAEVALGQTVIRAPFDGLVLAEEVAEGTMLSTGATAATLAATDRFHVILAVPVSALEWIDPQGGQTVRLTQPGVWPEGSFREGRIERLAGGLSEAGRMAELVVAVDDPLARQPENLGKPRLLLGSFLQGAAQGRAMEAAIVLDRVLLHDGDTVWVMTPENRLEIRPVGVAWRGAETVLVTGGLAAGERVVTTPLAIVAPGMALRLAGGDGG